MFPKKFKINMNNHTGSYGGLIWENSVTVVTDEIQMRVIEKLQAMGDYKIEEIKEEKQEAADIVESDAQKRRNDAAKNSGVDTKAPENVPSGDSGRSGQKEHRPDRGNNKKAR